MSTNEPEERALEVMRKELAAEETPSLPWDAMERELLAKLERQEADRPAPRRDARARIGIALAAAAAVALAVGFSSRNGGHEEASGPAVRWRLPESIAFLPGSESERDLSTLRVGDGVEAGEAPLALVHRGTVRVTLAPKARAFVVSAPSRPGEALVLGLEHGSLRAEVTPRSSESSVVESFAVDVGQTRVAAHGTAFRVIRGESDVVVDLEHGSVAVGLSGRSSVTTGRLLVGRARASFSLDGGSVARMLPTDDAEASATPPAIAPGLSQPSVPPAPASADTSALEAPQAAPSSRHHAALSPPVVAPSAEPLPSVLPEPPPERVLTRASVHAGLGGCFEQHYGKADPAVRLSVSGTVVVTVDEAGSVSAVRFDPPLEPPFMSCVFASLKPGHFSEPNTKISVPFQLGR